MSGETNPRVFFRNLCRADPRELSEWLKPEKRLATLLFASLIIIAGCGLYGFSIGIWRSPLQGTYVGIKLPLLIFLTCLGNALLNSILAMVLGSRLSLIQTGLCILLSFAIFSLVVGGLTPISAFLVMNLPDAASDQAKASHSFIMLTHTFVIAYAGIMGNWKLYQLLKYLTPSAAIAGRTLFAWLAGNLFLGAQLSWVLRPFFGTPSMDVEFLRDNPMQGNFYEALWSSFITLLNTL